MIHWALVGNKVVFISGGEGDIGSPSSVRSPRRKCRIVIGDMNPKAADALKITLPETDVEVWS
jgi:hypothetical protein